LQSHEITFIHNITNLSWLIPATHASNHHMCPGPPLLSCARQSMDNTSWFGNMKYKSLNLSREHISQLIYIHIYFFVACHGSPWPPLGVLIYARASFHFTIFTYVWQFIAVLICTQRFRPATSLASTTPPNPADRTCSAGLVFPPNVKPAAQGCDKTESSTMPPSSTGS